MAKLKSIGKIEKILEEEDRFLETINESEKFNIIRNLKKMFGLKKIKKACLFDLEFYKSIINNEPYIEDIKNGYFLKMLKHEGIFYLIDINIIADLNVADLNADTRELIHHLNLNEENYRTKRLLNGYIKIFTNKNIDTESITENIVPLDENLVNSVYRDRPEDSSHFYEHLASRD